MCFLAFSHQYLHKFLSKATNYFSQMLQQRWEAKICRKGSSLQLGLELTTTRSRVQRAHHWANRSGSTIYPNEVLSNLRNGFGQMNGRTDRRIDRQTNQQLYACPLGSVKLEVLLITQPVVYVTPWPGPRWFDTQLQWNFLSGDFLPFASRPYQGFITKTVIFW